MPPERRGVQRAHGSAALSPAAWARRPRLREAGALPPRPGVGPDPVPPQDPSAREQQGLSWDGAPAPALSRESDSQAASPRQPFALPHLPPSGPPPPALHRPLLCARPPATRGSSNAPRAELSGGGARRELRGAQSSAPTRTECRGPGPRGAPVALCLCPSVRADCPHGPRHVEPHLPQREGRRARARPPAHWGPGPEGAVAPAPRRGSAANLPSFLPLRPAAPRALRFPEAETPPAT